jgi:hypothetical protein
MTFLKRFYLLISFPSAQNLHWRQHGYEQSQLHISVEVDVEA